MEKQSKVKSVQATGTWDGHYGTMYKFEVEFENGDVGEYSAKTAEQTKFIEGVEAEYTFTGDKFKKVKPIFKPMPGAYKGTLDTSPANANRETLIIRQSCLKVASELYVNGKLKNVNEMIEKANLFVKWVQLGGTITEKTKKETTDLPF